MTMRWTPPDPRKLPDWRSSMIEYLDSLPAKRVMREAIHAGHSTLLPMIPGLDASVGAIGAELLHRSEIHRLATADLYYATPDMTALALAASGTPPSEPVSLDRLPSRTGLIVFAEPIGGYKQEAGQVLAGTLAHKPGATATVTTPIVAASWSPWQPDSVRLDGGGHRVRWLYKSGGRSGFLPDDFTGIWVTFYSPRGTFDHLDPRTAIGRQHDGSDMTAGQISSLRRTAGPVLAWDNEMVMREGGRFEKPQPDTNAAWTIALYTAWQLMTQKAGQWTETQTAPRSRSGVKRDARQTITGSSDVQIVNVHTSQRPSRSQADQDAAVSTGRREPQWTCRWPVRPYRRNTCLNPRAHADDGCVHEERIVPGHVKGPADAPLRVRDTVHLWNRQPNAQA
ncbi:hypothetical protein B0E38_01802 [Streptomyces sp. 111WW2]|uniref:hypothetical protein n=1 Tax=Streptomyces sp. 111WW2 TaxID=1945515 RepID=UPI000D0C8DB1|nr:hypothetical protein [Streptomyces sp. 111WW2]PSK57957.1 hypothetical protein B0E38_01802 [Streptomyces sp. 111WW2]